MMPEMAPPAKHLQVVWVPPVAAVGDAMPVMHLKATGAAAPLAPPAALIEHGDPQPLPAPTALRIAAQV